MHSVKEKNSLTAEPFLRERLVCADSSFPDQTQGLQECMVTVVNERIRFHYIHPANTRIPIYN